MSTHSDDQEPDEVEKAVQIAESYSEPTGKPPRMRDLSVPALMRLVHRTEEERQRLEVARQRVEAQERQLTTDLANVQRELAEIGERNAGVVAREHALLTELKTQVDRTEGLAEAIQELRKATTDRLSAEAADALAALEAATERARGRADELVAGARDRAEAIVAQGEATVAVERAELDGREQELDRRARRLAHLEATQQQFEEQVREEAELRVTDEIDALRRRLHTTEAALRRVREERRVLEANAEAQRERTERIGNRSADEVVAEIERLERRAADAEMERDQRPAPSVLAERDAALARAVAAERDADSLRARLAESAGGDAERRRLSAAVTELEQEREALEQSRVRLQRRIGDLRADLDLLGDATEVEPPDKDLLDIDALSRRREVDEVRWRRAALTLPLLLEETQARMVSAGLFYSTEDLRLFIAGLAASHLHVLEGISGTGKTSLPIAFARAVDGFSPVIEVQAAWRDRLDLMGSYNAFDRRYYPTDFARALYQAATPGWRDTICLIVLDEMNLAHPEYYFADVLSAMESGKRRVEALPRAIGQASMLFDHRSVPFGDNVWFIGTANRDETTSSIADKTYDRASVMELPDRHLPFTPGTGGEDDGAIAASTLHRLFHDAQARHAKTADEVLAVTHDDALRAAATTLRIGFGNRLSRLVRGFAPVVVATGGSVQDALDHVLATKLVRKLESRFDAKPEHLDALEDALRAAAGAEIEALARTARELRRQRERLEA